MPARMADDYNTCESIAADAQNDRLVSYVQRAYFLAIVSEC